MDDPSADEVSAISVNEDVDGDRRSETIAEIASRSGGVDSQIDSDEDIEVSNANLYKPSTMAISFLAELDSDTFLVVEATGGRYRDKTVQVGDAQRTWWLRSPVGLTSKFSCAEIMSANVPSTIAPFSSATENTDGLALEITLIARPYGGSNKYLFTVCLINRKPKMASANLYSLFQAHFVVRLRSPRGTARILPYPAPAASDLDPEEESISLLYRYAETFAVGHGCAANWELSPGAHHPEWLSAECLPTFETPSITPEVQGNGVSAEVSMAALAGLVPDSDGFPELAQIIQLYEQWIIKKTGEIGALNKGYRAAAERHMEVCSTALKRMRQGLEYLRMNEDARRAFQLANHAMLIQQARSRREARRAVFDAKAKRVEFSPPLEEPDLFTSDRGKWRAFQIAFLLLSIRSSAEADDPDRSTVELIWFPTGGGKTEAYLGLAAFCTFLRLLRNSYDAGVHTLMRYTLRLLTAQQFQRASGLICAMEYLRRLESRAGRGFSEEQISIGIWLGGSSTPNSRAEAIKDLRALNSPKKYTENKFLLGRCPWCGAQMGVLRYAGETPSGAPRVIGYEPEGNTVVFKCPDNRCEFKNGLPVYVVDEDIYEQRPSLIIGTVDKFAMLAWRPKARRIFGIDDEGQRELPPPGLIIQDELHLIAGPLGSMVGLYEAVVEELCTNRNAGMRVVPKIVSSTATIRRHEEQVKALYARNKVNLFPPPGLEASDSFFARFATSPDGRPVPGHLYVGVHGAGLGSLQTVQVRTFASLLQAPVALSLEERDPWWTLMLFFNSLRELGTTLSLFQSDIPDRFSVLRNRLGLASNDVRRFWRLRELTGRLNSSQVPEAISALEVTTTSSDAIDVCLASNIIEVGVDIDRLSLMSVVGQPKTTSQYIQVTGRVGRKWRSRPGLIITIYSASKPRDRSHFEKFRTYHERLYAQVEPTSVTPFSPPALDRALHAVMTVYARQLGDKALANRPYPFPADLIDRLREILIARVKEVDNDELENFERVFEIKSQEWKRWGRMSWEGKWDETDPPLLREAGAYVSRERKRLSWPTLRSMRNVDAECQAQITQLYINDEIAKNA
ncbi:MAG TPA: helicase-related protein [Pyrinomonadaceae bacterium]|nr:helicase-related protein [Pyrinomonadaceae bacterium]